MNPPFADHGLLPLEEAVVCIAISHRSRKSIGQVRQFDNTSTYVPTHRSLVPALPMPARAVRF